MIVVGLVGFIGSGKGTAGDILKKLGFRQDAFAAPVKDAVAAIFGWNRAALEGDTQLSRSFREQPDEFWSEAFGRRFTPREALQKMGTECGRNVYHPDLWTKALEYRITAAQAADDHVNYVITDVRFPNEAKMIRELGGYVIEVARGEQPEWYNYAAQLNEDNNWNGKVQTMADYPEIHYSEWAWIGSPEITSVIDNNGTVEQLEANLLEAIDL